MTEFYLTLISLIALSWVPRLLATSYQSGLVWLPIALVLSYLLLGMLSQAMSGSLGHFFFPTVLVSLPVAGLSLLIAELIAYFVREQWWALNPAMRIRFGLGLSIVIFCGLVATHGPAAYDRQQYLKMQNMCAGIDSRQVAALAQIDVDDRYAPGTLVGKKPDPNQPMHCIVTYRLGDQTRVHVTADVKTTAVLAVDVREN